MDDPTARPPRHRRPNAEAGSQDGTAEESSSESSAAEDAPTSRVDLTGLSVAGITRRRVGWSSAALLAAWIVIVFARQVGDAQAAANGATQAASDNEALAAEVQALQSELDLVVQPDFVAMEARGYRLGNPREVPFTLDPSVPAPVEGAPGSSSVRLGAPTSHETPLESWLQLLFGPAG